MRKTRLSHSSMQLKSSFCRNTSASVHGVYLGGAMGFCGSAWFWAAPVEPPGIPHARVDGMGRSL